MCHFMNITIRQKVSQVNVLRWKAGEPITEDLLSSSLMRNEMMKTRSEYIHWYAFENKDGSAGNA